MKKDNEWGFYTLPTQIDPEKRAIERLKIASEMSLKNYGTPLVVTTSGGKDSSVCVELAQRASIPFEVQHNHTTADAPETVRFVRQEFARLENLGIKCTVNYPTYKGKRTSMWGLIPQKLMPPTRMARYCCEVLKEHGGDGHFVCTGVRWGESARRAKMRGIFEKQVKDRDRSVKVQEDGGSLEELFAPCKLKAKHIVNPIIDWTTSQVWDFLRDSKVPVNPLYECGFDRVGCVGCPLAGKKAVQGVQLLARLRKVIYTDVRQNAGRTPQTREDARKLDDGRYRARCIPLVDGGGRAAWSNELI